MPAETGTIGIHFPGLIQLLAKNLYPQDDMFLRELIQNAHDSIQKRDDLGLVPAGRINIRGDLPAKTITIEDNGAGMERQEIVDYLATIGRSGTGELRASLIESDRARAEKLIGQFGIGMLSAFVVADQIVVETRSAVAAGGGLRWTVQGGPEYSLEPMHKPDTGTRVTLHLKDEFLGLTESKRLTQIVKKYADFLPFPIYVGSDGPANTMQAPWHRSYSNLKEKRQAYFEFVDRRFPDIPLEIIPVELTDPHPVTGVLYISDRHVPDVNMAGIVDVYQARMFIREGDRSLLPLWAKFVGGVIDSPALRPTAARDAIQEDVVHAAVREALGKLILDTLVEMSRREPQRFQRLMEWHRYHIIGMAVEFDDFFDAVADVVLFDVNETEPDGHTPVQVNIPAYLAWQTQTDERGRKIVYYINEQGTAPQFFRLCQAQGLRALNASLVFQERFLEKYADRYPQTLALRRVNLEDNEAIFIPLSDTERIVYADIEFKLQRLFQSSLPGQETIVRTERFKPEDLPAVLTQTREHEALSKLDQIARYPSIVANGLSEMIKDVIGVQRPRTPPIILHVNADCPLIDQLRAEDFNDAAIRVSWLSVYNNAFLYSRQYLSLQNQEVLHGQTIQVLQNLLTLRRDHRKLHDDLASLRQQSSPTTKPVSRTPHISLFVMMPFSADHSGTLERALRLVFENDPYYFQIILDKDRTSQQNLFDNVSANMRLVHGFIADVGDHNPNVMIELGITASDTEDRPSFLLLRNGSERLPADLHGRLYVSYELPVESTGDAAANQLADQLRGKFNTNERILALRRSRTCRFLSTTLIRQRLPRLHLEDTEALEICRVFRTVEGIQGKSAEAIAQATGLPEALAAPIAVAFR